MNRPQSKIVNLSLHRSATESFHNFMVAHGLRSSHWPGWDVDEECREPAANVDTAGVFHQVRRIVEGVDACADLPFCLLYRELLQTYPDATFLLVLRPVHSWSSSVRRHLGTRRMGHLEKMQYWRYADARKNFIYEYSDLELDRIYVRHCLAVVNAMHQAGARFRVFELDETSLDQSRLAAELSGFIGLEQRASFPAINVSVARRRA